MPQPAQFTVEEGAQIVHPVFQHRQPVDAGAKGKALPFRRIKPTGPDDIGVNHAGAQHFHPSFRPANDALPLLHRITDIDLHRRFSEGEITGPQTKNDVVTLKKCRSEEHTSELQSLMRISYAVLCLKKKT